MAVTDYLSNDSISMVSTLEFIRWNNYIKKQPKTKQLSVDVRLCGSLCQPFVKADSDYMTAGIGCNSPHDPKLDEWLTK